MSFGKRFADERGTNPEELIAAAHATCYAMALANTLAKEGHPPTRLNVSSQVSLDTSGGGAKISRSKLAVRGRVDGLDGEAFRKIAEQAEQACPVSNALRRNLEITLDASLAS